MSAPTGFDGRGWLSAHVNLESLNVPAGSRRGPPTLERIATLFKPEGFFDPKTPSGGATPPERPADAPERFRTWQARR